MTLFGFPRQTADIVSRLDDPRDARQQKKGRRGGGEGGAYFRDAQNIVGIPKLLLGRIRRHDQICHQSHQAPAGHGDNRPLDLALLPLLSRA